MATKQHRELETQVHDQVYNNIYLLTLKHAPSSEFTKVFKKDMFLKSNKVAFQQVIYYLLNILNPTRLAQKITSWPYYDSRGESQFRNEVMKYINELNSLYESADIPTVLVSHLVTPGGHKFIKFMLKLTQLVIYEELQKDSNISRKMLHRILPNKNPEYTQANIQKLKEKTRAIDEVTRNFIKQFNTNLVLYREKAEGIMQKQRQINAELPGLRLKLETLQEKTQDEDYNETDADIKLLQNEMNHVDNFDVKLKHLRGLVTLLCSGDLCLEGGSVDDNPEGLNLLDLLHEFDELLVKKCLEMRVLTAKELSQSVEKYSALNDEMQRFLNGLSDIQKKFSAMMMDIKPSCVKGRCIFSSVTKSDDSVIDADSTILAMPLDDS